MVHALASFLRWRLKINRWVAKGLNAVAALPSRLMTSPASYVPSALLTAVLRDGCAKLDRTIEVPLIDLAPHAGSAAGTAFVDIAGDHRDVVTQAFVELLGDPDTANLVNGYFNGRPWLWNASLNYSDPMKGLNDSQLWHFDYGDTRQLHLLLYFTDVDLDSGPFTFLPLAESGRIRRHPMVIERLDDAALMRDYAIDTAGSTQRLTGLRGEIFACDPGRLMHQGARCVKQRLVLFVTFTSPAPMSRGGAATISGAERQRLGQAYRQSFPGGALAASTFH